MVLGTGSHVTGAPFVHWPWTLVSAVVRRWLRANGLVLGVYAMAVVGAVVGEFIAANSGLGYLLLVANQSFDAPLLFGIVLLLSVQSIALFYLVELIEALVLPQSRLRPSSKPACRP